MVTFERMPYGLKLTFTGGRADQNIADLIAQGEPYFSSMQPGWRLISDVREAPIMTQEDFGRVAAFMAGFKNPEARGAVLVNSAIFAMQLRRLYKSVGAEERFRVIEAGPGDEGMREAEAFVQ